MAEAKFEAALIKKLEAEGWTYRKDLSYVSIKVLEGHWREVLNENNAYKLNGKPLSDVEFGLVIQEVQRIKTPYDVQLLLVGAGGVGSIPITRDDGSNLEVWTNVKYLDTKWAIFLESQRKTRHGVKRI